MATPLKDRQKSFVKRQQDKGFVKFNDWIHPDDKQEVRQLMKDLVSKRELVIRIQRGGSLC